MDEYKYHPGHAIFVACVASILATVVGVSAYNVLSNPALATWLNGG